MDALISAISKLLVPEPIWRPLACLDAQDEATIAAVLWWRRGAAVRPEFNRLSIPRSKVVVLKKV
jgi:hypothetical protein